MKISVFGVGYVGLVTGTGFSEMGNEVVCVDIDPQKIENLKMGIIPIYEPGLEDLVIKNQKAKRLNFTTDGAEAISHGQVIFIAVGTPSDKDGKADLQYVLNVAALTGEQIEEDKVVVVKSTVPVGSCKKVQDVINAKLSQRSASHKVSVVSNPEFLKEGTAVEDFLRPDRIVVGVNSEAAEKTMEKLYSPFLRNGHPLLVMSVESSEMTKYVANAMLATKISFMNQMSRLAEKFGADIQDVRRGIGSDRRIGFDFIYPGLGYGGSCFPKDVRALVSTAREYNLNLPILEKVEEINKTQIEWFFTKMVRFFDGQFSNRKIALWGLAFKPGTDDIREAPAVQLSRFLLGHGAQIQVFDPVAMNNFKSLMGNNPSITYCSDMYDCLDGSDALVLVTEWREFREPNFGKIKSLLKTPALFDGRNQWNPRDVSELGFRYYSVGR